MDRLSLINILFDPDQLPLETGDLKSMPGYHALFKLEPHWRKKHEFRSRLCLTASELVYATRLADQLDHELRDRQPGFGVVAISVWLQLAAFLSRCYSNAKTDSGKTLLRIAEVVSHLERNYTDLIRLEDLIALSGMSRRTFLRSFEACFGCPPITYLIRLRLRHGCHLLQSTSLGITEIALRVGFSDSNYFSRKFRTEYGLSPRAYRSRRPTQLSEVEVAN